MSKPSPQDEVAELRRRLDMAEDELTFLKAVFEEYKDSSGELEAELDAQLKDLERSNLALKRENEQIRAQLQSTVMRSRKSAEEASNLTTALEAHLEELTKREKKAQSRIRMLEQENEQLKKDLETRVEPPAAVVAAPAAAPVPMVSSAELQALQSQVTSLKSERSAQAASISQIKTSIYENRVKTAKLLNLSRSRFAVQEDVKLPEILPEDLSDVQSIQADNLALTELLDKTLVVMSETGLATMLVEDVSRMLADPDKARQLKLDGQTELAINKSCLVILGRVIGLGESLPEFKRAVSQLKAALKDAADNAQASSQLAHTILMLAQDIMVSVFDPMREVGREEELKHMKEETIHKIELARREGEQKALVEAESRLAREKADAERKLADMQRQSESQVQSARAEAKSLAEKARREALEEAAVQRKALEEEIYQSVAAEMDALREALEKSEAQYTQAAMKQQMYQNSMKNAVLDQSKAMLAAMMNARQELETLKRSTQVELAETQKMLNENLDHVRKVARTMAKSDIAQLSMMYERELELRVKLQDQVQALKGNIRVFCRIRPLLSQELEDGEVEAVNQTNEMTVTAADPEDPGKTSPFSFDRVFGPSDSQEVVFDEMKTLCLSAMDGFNVCLFAYGVTGSGKTFTVEGGERARDNPKLHGLVYRTLKEIFRIAYGERAGAYETKIEVQLLELYQEDFRDLLQEDGYKGPKPVVRLIPDVGVLVDNVIKVPVTKTAEALEIVKRGYRNRTTRSTDMNSVSSRSHSILTVHLTGTNLKTKKTYAGKLHFIDLAGSERIGRSGVTGEALKEAQAINSSLSALGDVIQALSKKEKFVPYRNSELTKLLQESLGGNSKTVMIVNVSPALQSMGETINSLRFATRAHQVEMGKATQLQVATDTVEVKSIKNKMADLESKFKTGKTAPAPAATRGPSTSVSGAGANLAAPASTPRRKSGDKIGDSSPGRQSLSGPPPPAAASGRAKK